MVGQTKISVDIKRISIKMSFLCEFEKKVTCENLFQVHERLQPETEQRLLCLLWATRAAVIKSRQTERMVSSNLICV